MNIYDTIVQIIVFWLGAAIGSFLNVVVYRVPAGVSILWPPSRCPKCFHQLGMGENIPILGWLLLRGKCRHCRTPISPRYPLIEAITAITFVLIYNRYGLSIQTIGYSLLMCWLLALTLIDLDTMTLPNPLTQSGLMLGLMFQATVGYVDNHAILGGKEYLIQGIIGMVVGIWIYDMIQLVGSLMMGQLAQGGGDAKLMAMVGAWTSWKVVLLAGGLASALALVGFVAVAGSSVIKDGSLTAGSKKLTQPLPLGPFIAVGATIALFWGDALMDGYQQLMLSPDRYALAIPLLIFLSVLLIWTRKLRLQG